MAWLTPAFLAALTLAAVMGVIVQKGGTCMVDAVRQLARERRANRIAAIIECALVTGLLMAAAHRWGITVPSQRDHALGLRLVMGGVLLGLGAFVNGACLFGTVARVGTRQFAWALTPVGFLLAAAAVTPMDEMTGGSRPLPALLVAAPALLLGLALMLRLRVRVAGLAPVNPDDRRFHWFTVLGGVLATGITVLAGPWSWTESLTGALHHEARAGFGLALTAALFTGALAGGWRSRASWTTRRAVTCLLGGALMGAGATLVPGGNDALVLNAMPAPYLYAWVAVAVMIGTILIAIAVEERLRS